MRVKIGFDNGRFNFKGKIILTFDAYYFDAIKCEYVYLIFDCKYRMNLNFEYNDPVAKKDKNNDAVEVYNWYIEYQGREKKLPMTHNSVIKHLLMAFANFDGGVADMHDLQSELEYYVYEVLNKPEAMSVFTDIVNAANELYSEYKKSI